MSTTGTIPLPSTLDSLDGLRAALDRPPVTYPSMTARQYAGLNRAARAEFNALRHRHMARTTLTTPAMDEAFKVSRRLLLSNPELDHGRRALGLSGPAHSGKTMTALAVARRVEKTALSLQQTCREDGVVPVAFVNVPAGASAKSLLHAICGFYVPWTHRRATTDELVEFACNLVRERRTQMLILDEFHNLKPYSTNGAVAADLVKALQNKLTCTFLFAGINLEGSKALGSEPGQQILSRTNLIHLAPRSTSTKQGLADWTALVEAFDKKLPLLGHRPGVVTEHALQLHGATGGQIGGLAKILHDLTADIIIDQQDRQSPSETLTAKMLKTALLANARGQGAQTSGPKARRKSA